MAKILHKSSMMGAGCLLQFLGLVSILMGFLTILSVIGPIILFPLAIWLIYYGGKKASWFECSDCGSRLSRKNLKICPNCNSTFSINNGEKNSTPIDLK